VVFITRGLARVLLDLAREADPESVTASLAVSPLGDLTRGDRATADPLTAAREAATVTGGETDETDEPTPETPVFTDFYLPDTAESVSAVFGVDLATPPGQTQGRFVSHPLGRLELDRTDDLHEAVFVAVPPWDLDSVAAFDRSGRRRSLWLLDAHPPAASFAHD
jgi:hypothetical protein